MSVNKSKKKYLKPKVEDLDVVMGEEVGGFCSSGIAAPEHCQDGDAIQYPQPPSCHYGDHAFSMDSCMPGANPSPGYCSSGNLVLGT